jgi:hypothetical protein
VTWEAGWRSETVVALATGIHFDNAFDRVPILADALEEAGCDDEDVLTHCRGPAPHARGNPQINAANSRVFLLPKDAQPVAIMAADPIAQEPRWQGDGGFFAFNTGQGHLSKPAAEFHIAHFFAQLCADAGPSFSPGSRAGWGQVFALLFHASQNAAPLHLQNINPDGRHHAADSMIISIVKTSCAQISTIARSVTRMARKISK